MKRPHRNHSPEFKAKVALAAVKGEQTLSELAERYDVHATRIAQWKAELPERAANSSFPAWQPSNEKALFAL